MEKDMSKVALIEYNELTKFWCFNNYPGDPDCQIRCLSYQPLLDVARKCGFTHYSEVIGSIPPSLSSVFEIDDLSLYPK